MAAPCIWDEFPLRSVTLVGSNLGITPEPKAAADPTVSTFWPPTDGLGALSSPPSSSLVVRAGPRPGRTKAPMPAEDCFFVKTGFSSCMSSSSDLSSGPWSLLRMLVGARRPFAPVGFFGRFKRVGSAFADDATAIEAAAVLGVSLGDRISSSSSSSSTSMSRGDDVGERCDDLEIFLGEATGDCSGETRGDCSFTGEDGMTISSGSSAVGVGGSGTFFLGGSVGGTT